MSGSTFASEYEAHYRLIHVQEADLYRWTAWCTGESCDWGVTEYTWADARHVALAHCRERHVRES